MYVITEYSLFVPLLYWGHTCLIAMDTNRTHRSVARCLARPSQQPMKGMVTCTMPGIVMSLVVPFRLTRYDVKESALGRVFQRYSRGQDVKVLQLADVTAKVTIPYWLIIQHPVCSSGRQSSPAYCSNQLKAFDKLTGRNTVVSMGGLPFKRLSG